jgi:hypothetical protein
MADRPRPLLFTGSDSSGSHAVGRKTLINVAIFKTGVAGLVIKNHCVESNPKTFPREIRTRHSDPFGTEFFEAGAGQPFAFKDLSTDIKPINIELHQSEFSTRRFNSTLPLESLDLTVPTETSSVDAISS